LWYEIFFSSHPSLRARIAALEPATDEPAATPQDPSSA
jgi:Zn-dependent protease with chaperone function